MKRYLFGGILGAVGGSVCGMALGMIVLLLGQSLRIAPRSHGSDQLIMIAIFAVVGSILIGTVGLIVGLSIAALRAKKAQRQTARASTAGVPLAA
jgi:hypothetical protein